MKRTYVHAKNIMESNSSVVIRFEGLGVKTFRDLRETSPRSAKTMS